MAYTRNDWNDLIDQVNDVLQNPPPDTDCEPLPTIDHVGPTHRWSKADITEVQDALKATCEDISFDTIPELWKQSIIDEINNAIGMAWCDCEPDDDCSHESIMEENGTEFLVYDNGPPKVSSNCFGDVADASIPLCDLIHGMTVGAPNIVGRLWRVTQRSHRNGGGTFVNSVVSGRILCNGTVKCIGLGADVNLASGAYVFCPTCIDDTCSLALAAAGDTVANDPDISYQTWTLEIVSTGADCADCAHVPPGI